MSPQDSQISSDLEWMLQSGQASPGMLAEALVKEYFPALYSLALSILDDESAAWLAASRTIQKAILNASGYQSTQGVRTWLFRHALEVCWRLHGRLWLRQLIEAFIPQTARPFHFRGSVPQSQVDEALWPAVDSLPDRERIPFLLHTVHGWDIPTIAGLLSEREGEIRLRLGIALEKLGAVLRSAVSLGSDFGGAETVHRVNASLASRWSTTYFAPAELERITGGIAGDLDRQRLRQRRSISFGENLWVLVAVLLAVGVLWGSSRLLLPQPTPLPPALPAAQVQRPTPSRVPPTRTPLPPTSTTTRTPTASPTLPPMVYYYSYPGETLRSIAARLKVSVDELIRINSVGSPDARLVDGTQIRIPVYLPPDPVATPTQVKTSDYRLHPLQVGSSSQAIYQFLLLSDHLWNTLWADGLYIEYGPQGYVGPPLVARDQVWVSQPDQSNELVGPLRETPRFHMLIQDGLLYQLYPQPGYDYLNIASGPLDHSLIQELIYPQRTGWINQAGMFKGVGRQVQAGREAVVVDWLNSSGQRERRFWVDAEKGLILRLQVFSGSDGRTLLEEKVLQSVALDINLPGQLFNPLVSWKGGYAQNPEGQPEQDGVQLPDFLSTPAPGHAPLSKKAAPQGFDPAHSSLTFQFQPGSEINLTLPRLPVASLFADRYYLGEVEFARPWQVICTRSADGNRVAFFWFNHWLDSLQSMVPAELRWFDLRDPEDVHSLPDNLGAFNLAFAPDNRHLAFSGFGVPDYGLYLLDTENDQVGLVTPLQSVGNLIWSPDGRYVGLIGKEKDEDTYEAMVIEVGLGKIVYRTPVDLSIGYNTPADPLDPEWPAPDWPGHSWGVKLSVTAPRGMEACTAPP